MAYKIFGWTVILPKFMNQRPTANNNREK